MHLTAVYCTEPLLPLFANDLPPELIFKADIRRNTRILKHIPRAVRHLAATKLAGTLDDVTIKNDSDSRERLFKFAGRCLAQPQRGGQHRSPTSAVKCMLEVEADPVAPRVAGLHSCFRLFDPMESLAKRVSAKLEDGDYGGAVRIPCSEDVIADITPDTLSALLEKTHVLIQIPLFHLHQYHIISYHFPKYWKLKCFVP